MADYLMAGICLAWEAVLLTRNRAQFERIPGLTLAELERSDARSLRGKDSGG